MAISTQDVNIDGQPISTTASQATGTNLHVVTDATSTTIATQTTGTNLHTVTDSGSTTAVTGNVTVVQPTGTNLHTVVDSGTISATQGTSPWVISGTVTVGTGSTATITQVSVTNAASITLLAANANRKKAIFTIPSIGTALFIGYTATTNTTTTFTWKLVTNNSTLEELNYTGVISAIATGATDVVTVTEIV
jgi:hypothetical protein